MLTRGRGALGAALAVVTALVLSGCSLVPASWSAALGQANTVTAYFDDVSGLYEGSDVSVLGMPIGRILSVEPHGTRVEVEMTVDEDIPIPRDVTAAIVNTSIVTTRHIELSPTYSGGPRLQDGDAITKTKSPVQIGTLFDAIDDLVKNLSSGQPGAGPLADLVDITSGIADGNGEKLRDALDALEKAAQTGADNGNAIVDIVRSLSTLTTTLTDNYPKMLTFSSSLTSVSEMLGEQSVGLVATLDDLNRALANTSQFLEQNSDAISSSTGRLASLAANLSDFSREVVEAIDVAPLLFQNLSNSVSAEQGAWRTSVFLSKSLLDNELTMRLCEALKMNDRGCRTNKLKDFGPDLGIYSGLLELSSE